MSFVLPSFLRSDDSLVKPDWNSLLAQELKHTTGALLSLHRMSSLLSNSSGPVCNSKPWENSVRRDYVFFWYNNNFSGLVCLIGWPAYLHSVIVPEGRMRSCAKEMVDCHEQLTVTFQETVIVAGNNGYLFLLKQNTQYFVTSLTLLGCLHHRKYG